MTSTNYDVIVIGASQGGRLLPIEFAKAGRRVALIERDEMGGVCVNVGCTPTKTMVASARLAYQARRAAEYGVQVGPVSVDLQAVRLRKQGMVEGARLNYQSRLSGLQGLDLLLGEAHFLSPKTVEVSLKDGGTRQITAPLIVIDTGGRPKLLAIEGVASVPVLNSTTIMELDALPEHLLIVGGGYIGLEFAQMFRRFGSQVTIIQSRPRLLMNEDEDVSEEITRILREDGITVLTATMPQRGEPIDGGRMRLTVRTSQGEQQLTGSRLLGAIGRVPNTDALTPEAAGIRLDENGFIQVNEHLETNVAGIYAMGDVKGGPAFTHVSYDDFRVVCTNLLENGQASTRDRLIPHVVFIDPQLGRVGMTENEARKQGRTIRVAKLPMNAVIRALETRETRGFMKTIIDAETQQILGCAILGVEGGEIMTIIQVAMMGNLPYTALKEGVFTHPLLAEGLNTLFMLLDANGVER
jgi:pyruvate/2-oxoglutarate dehydrogenase complex dihydrolipoamide dehydrogenase (E3) component